MVSRNDILYFNSRVNCHSIFRFAKILDKSYHRKGDDCTSTIRISYEHIESNENVPINNNSFLNKAEIYCILSSIKLVQSPCLTELIAIKENFSPFNLCVAPLSCYTSADAQCKYLAIFIMAFIKRVERMKIPTPMQHAVRQTMENILTFSNNVHNVMSSMSSVTVKNFRLPPCAHRLCIKMCSHMRSTIKIQLCCMPNQQMRER